MQSSLVTLTCGSHVLFYTPAYVIRGMVNFMDIILLDDAGAALDITDVSTWDLGITEDFFGETGVLAGSSTITAAENVLSVTMNGHTEELASLMDGKKSIQAYATLRGRDAGDVINRLYVFPVVILNIGFTNDTILTTAAQELTYTKAQIDYLLSQLGAEKIENKTQEIDTEEPSAVKYPSESALVAYGSGKVDKVEGKGLSTNDYTNDDKTAVGKIELETLAELTGAHVTIAPWTQSKWSASGVCSLTASGWAESGTQTSEILITLAAGATPSIIDAEVSDDDVLDAAGIYDCFIRNEDGTVRFKIAGFTEAV